MSIAVDGLTTGLAITAEQQDCVDRSAITAGRKRTRTVMVSGCYDILHGGHVEFFLQAKAQGERLVVSVASDEVLWAHKQRKPSIPLDHKVHLIESLSMVDEVVVGDCDQMGLDFKDHFLRIRPDCLVVTEDDKFEDEKRQLCSLTGAEYVVLPKTLGYDRISTTEIVDFIKAPAEVPLRVDFAGGWLDVPRLARPGTYIVNCAFSPLVSLRHWPYEQCSGLGGSAAHALLVGRDGVQSELDLGVGWQDPAVIRETGLCAWRSGPRPLLEVKLNPELLRGRLGLLWTGSRHDTPQAVDRTRDYELIARAGLQAYRALCDRSLDGLYEAVRMSYQAQLGEGMDPLSPVEGAIAWKYCGGGWGGYAVYCFPDQDARDRSQLRRIEPFLACAGS